MTLVVSLRTPLKAAYGKDGFAAIQSALADYLDTRNGSARLLYLDDPDSMAPLGLVPLHVVEASAVLLSLRAVLRIIANVSDLLIIGGHEIIPFWQMRNPVQDRSIDPDPFVFTDNPYGSSSDTFDEYLAPSIPVGRIPDPWPPSAADFSVAINAITDNHRGRSARTGSAIVVNKDWKDLTTSIMEHLPIPRTVKTAPDYRLDTSNQSDTDCAFLYFNLHGFDNDPAWKGFDDIKGQFFPVALPDAFDQRFVSGSVIYAENCYGASVRRKNQKSSCALRLPAQGAAAFIGATGLAFGSHIVHEHGN